MTPSKRESLCKYCIFHEILYVVGFLKSLNCHSLTLYRFGMLFSLKDLVMKLSPVTSVEGLHVMKTNNFTLHHFQSLTGLAFIINSTPDVPGKRKFNMKFHCRLMQLCLRIFFACRFISYFTTHLLAALC